MSVSSSAHEAIRPGGFDTPYTPSGWAELACAHASQRRGQSSTRQACSRCNSGYVNGRLMRCCVCESLPVWARRLSSVGGAWQRKVRRLTAARQRGAARLSGPVWPAASGGCLASVPATPAATHMRAAVNSRVRAARRSELAAE